MVIKYNPIDDIVYGLEYGNQTAGKPIVNKISKQGLKSTGKYLAKEWMPITSDAWNMYSGGRKMFDKDSSMQTRLLGAGQAGLGALGLAALIASRGAFTPQQQVVKQAIKQGTKEALKYGLKRGATKALAVGSHVNTHPLLYTFGTEGADVLLNLNNTNNNKQSNVQPNKQSQQVTNNTSNRGYYNTGYSNMPVQGGGGIVSSNTVANPTTNKQPSKEAIDNQVTQPSNIDKILELYKQQYDSNTQPQVDAINNLINNYSNMAEQKERKQAYYAALAGLSNNPYYAGIGKDNNPIENEATRIDLMSKVGKTKQEQFDKMLELAGNIESAKQAGLPEEIALSSKPWLSMLGNLERANINADTQKYKADMLYKIAQYRGAIQQALQNQRLSHAERTRLVNTDNKLRIAQMRELNKSYIYTGGVTPDNYRMIMSGTIPAGGIKNTNGGVTEQQLRALGL